MTLQETCAPVVAAINDGYPLGTLKVGEVCPTLPPGVPMMVTIDDRAGHGPAAFDAPAIFDQVDGVIIAGAPEVMEQAAAALAINVRAGNGRRSLLVQTTAGRLASWLDLVRGRPRLARDFLVLGIEPLPVNVMATIEELKILSKGAAKLN